MKKITNRNLSDLYIKGIDVFESELKFGLWLQTENVELDNMTPINFISMTNDIDYIIDILGRIEHGILS